MAKRYTVTYQTCDGIQSRKRYRNMQAAVDAAILAIDCGMDHPVQISRYGLTVWRHTGADYAIRDTLRGLV